MVLASAVTGTVTAAGTAVGAAGSLNGNLFLPEPVVWIMVPKTNNWERTFLEAWYILPALATVRYCS